jgi:hypothetical protein
VTPRGYDSPRFQAASGLKERKPSPNLPNTGEIRLRTAKLSEFSAFLALSRLAFSGEETLIIKSTLSDGLSFHPLNLAWRVSDYG